MKILKVIALFILFTPAALSAQDIADHALGLRLGDNDGLGAEISYQKSLNRYNRLEVNLGWRDTNNFNAFKLAGIYQFVHAIEGNFNWYYGFGGGLGNVDFKLSDNGGLFVFLAGDIGVEYNFDFPLLLSLDIRPEIGILGYDNFNNNFDFDIALSIRYQF